MHTIAVPVLVIARKKCDRLITRKRETNGLIYFLIGSNVDEGMTFVYKGAGKKQRAEAEPCQKDRGCQKIACDIQWCLSRSNYKVQKCQHIVDKYNACCERVEKEILKRTGALRD